MQSPTEALSMDTFSKIEYKRPDMGELKKNLNKLLEDSKESTSFIIRNRSTRGRHRLTQFDRSKKRAQVRLGLELHGISYRNG